MPWLSRKSVENQGLCSKKKIVILKTEKIKIRLTKKQPV